MNIDNIRKWLIRSFQKKTFRVKTYVPPLKDILFSCLCLFFLLAFRQTDAPVKINEINALIEELAQIEDLNERGLTALIANYRMGLTNPNSFLYLEKELDVLWPNTYPLKSSILLLNKCEAQKIHGTFENTVPNTLMAIQLIEANPPLTLTEKKILCLAYLAASTYAKYTKDKRGIQFATKALELAKETKFPLGYVNAHNQIGLLIVYFDKNYKLALNHFEQAESWLNQLPPDQSYVKGYILGNIAKIWSELGDVEKSIEYKLNVLADKNNLDNLELILGTNNNLGTNYFDLKDYVSAKKHLQKTLDLMETHQVFTNQGIPLLRMGLINLEEEKAVQAEFYADAIDYWLINNQFIGDYEVLFYRFKSKLAQAKNDIEQAILWQEKAAKKQNALTNLLDANQLVNLEQQYKIQSIEHELLLLEKEKALNQATIQSQKIKLIASALVALLALLFSLIFYQQNSNLKEAYNFILKNRIPSNNRKQKSKQSSSGSPKEFDVVLKQKIMTALKNEKIYLDQNLTLKKFADHINSNTSYVSKTINEGCNKNFNALINE